MSMILDRSQELKERWAELKAGRQHGYTRNDALALGVSEAELLCTRLGEGVVRLRPDHKALLLEVKKLGKVTALTRNDHVVHERKGTYTGHSFEHGPVGLFVGKDIDLRIFWSHWCMAFAVEEGEGEEVRRSIQFFDKKGMAIHKIYLTSESDRIAFGALVQQFQDTDQNSLPVIEAAPQVPQHKLPDAQVDVNAFRNAWLGLQDTHDFHLLLRDHRLSRTQALRLAPAGYAQMAGPQALRALLVAAAQQQVPIMVFVGNPGMIQIHTGPIKEVVDARGWLNVLDPDFNLHVREEAIATAWVVTKPTTDGHVTALECFDEQGEQLIQLFGARKPGIPELQEWRGLVRDTLNITLP